MDRITIAAYRTHAEGQRFEISAFVTALLAAITADPHCILWDGTVPDPDAG